MEHALKTRRIAENLSVEAVADAVGVSKSTISRIETGQGDPSLSLVRKLCQRFPGLTANDFMVDASEVASPLAPEQGAAA